MLVAVGAAGAAAAAAAGAAAIIITVIAHVYTPLNSLQNNLHFHYAI